ncbi:sugar ABC transporter ATP-binding protein [Atribacter laminatus]|uniref:Galactose/methyl galactoside import ATP-binding protein MglA n=1 Tax=Atribacter laminatus TaxID=2847778 RepID=A0A7T1AJF8_ATRLM|nr:sugar ABC transporter ATP-binding protein [Atribacter laminatus]QPM67033.1 Galactose/methyl galactoside import ATP-binding protein MglA [Atribacter laminatus]
MSFGKEILRLDNICKSFPAVKALDQVNLSVRAGEVRGLVGENGAGKSTLIKVVTGAYIKDSGKMIFEDKEVSRNSPIISKELGIYAVYQDVMVAQDLSVAENFFLGNQPKRGPFIDWGKMHRESKKFLEEIEVDIDVKRSIKELSAAEGKMITIAKALWQNPKLVIFDEPTAVLTRNETKILFRIIKNLREKGSAIIYISHNLEEVFDTCDTVTVLKDGAVVGTYTTEELGSVEKLIPLMVGRAIEEMYYKKEVAIGQELLRVENLSGSKFKNITINVKAGEILGIFGLVGAGRTDIARAIFGADKFDKGKIIANGKEISIRKPKDSLKSGVGYLPEDRRNQGTFAQQDIEFNVNAINLDKVMKAGILNYKKAYEQTKEYVDKLSIKIGSVYQKVSDLSGGNQQKVVIARWLCRNPDVLIFDEPTAGIDVGTKAEIYRLFNEILNQEKGIILISSYLPELIGLSDRILVISNGMVAGEVERKDFSEEYLLTLAMKNIVSKEKIREAV